jgi:CO dehydrogenase/acetyl-CoA synthase epsilon subunit
MKGFEENLIEMVTNIKFTNVAHSLQKVFSTSLISWAKTLSLIIEEQVSIIKHARKSLLFYGETTWAKKNNASLFDVTMGSYDGAEYANLSAYSF